MRLLLIRHGESEHSRRGLVAGQYSCPGLTPAGRVQADLLRRRLSDDGVRADVLLSSTVPRARETAEILAPALALAPEDGVREDCRLCELHIGEGDGLETAEFAEQYGSFDVQVEADRPLSPGGETWNEFLARVPATLDDLRTTYAGRSVVAVTHAGFVVWTFLTLFGIAGSGDRARVDPAFTSVTGWEYDEDGSFWRLVTYNDTAHLRP